MQRTYIPSVKW